MPASAGLPDYNDLVEPRNDAGYFILLYAAVTLF